MSLDFVILAAGSGSRMKSSTPKIFQKIAEKPVIRYVIDTCKQIEHMSMVVVTTSELKNHELFRDTTTTVQGQQKGTGSAVISAIPAITSEYVIIMCGDMPLITKDHLNLLLNNNSDISFISMEIPERLSDMPYGRVRC